MAKYLCNEIDNSVLRRLQLTQVEILDEIVRICEANQLHYYLVGGTLLGAMRHKGFIPWDDDLDIAMPREDYIQFCNLCRTELNEDYYLHSIDTDRNYWLPLAKVRKKGTALNEGNIKDLDIPKGIYVDIFPLDSVPVEKKYALTRVIKILSGIIIEKIGIKSNYSIRHKMLSKLLGPFSIFHLTKLQLKLMQRYSSKYSYYINYGSNYDTVKQTSPKDKYEPYQLAEFEGKFYRIPNDADYVLRRIYNDYMQLPPVEHRVLRHKPDYIDFGE